MQLLILIINFISLKEVLHYSVRYPTNSTLSTFFTNLRGFVSLLFEKTLPILKQ
uniref:Uncharacterized protein n=1 Tax=Arundo donax TaxID=35708 RepID=A0A0A9BHX3_ARUDO